MRTIPLFLVLATACAADIPTPTVNVDVIVPEQDPPTIVVEVPGDEDDDTEVTDSDPADTDTVPEYNGQRAVLEGWMDRTGIQFADPGNMVDMGWWTFSLESHDGLDRVATIQPTAFHFTVESDGDGRFGTPVDQVVAGDIVHFCWLVQVWPDGHIGTVGHSDIGGPELNSMGGPYENHPVGSGDTLELGLRCNLHSDAPLGTKVAVSMSYNVISDADVYDASVARDDNQGTQPQYFVQVGPDSCGNYDMQPRYNVNDVSCSIPVMSFGTTGYSYPDSRNWFEMMGTWNIIDGVGEGVVVNDLAVKIEFDRVIDFDSTTILTADSPSLPGQWDTVPCTPGFDSFLGVSVMWCQAGDVDYTVTPQMRGFGLNMRINGLPTEVVEGVHMDVTAYFRWTDIATGFTTSDRGGYPVIDSDFLVVSPYHYVP